MKKIERINNQQKALKAYFKVKSKLDIVIGTTKNYWDIIIRIKHPSMRGKEREVKETLANPDEIRISKRARNVLLFYKKIGQFYLCVVVKVVKKRGFIVTAYWTKKIKEGESKWKR